MPGRCQAVQDYGSVLDSRSREYYMRARVRTRVLARIEVTSVREYLEGYFARSSMADLAIDWAIVV